MTLPIRLKIVLLTTTVLALSLGALLLVGVKFFIEDKNSYILDYNFNRVRTAAGHVEHQIDAIVSSVMLINSQPSLGETTFRDAATRHQLKGLLILQHTPEGGLAAEKTFGMDRHKMVANLDLLGWNIHRFEHSRYLVGRGTDGEMVLGVSLGNHAYVAFARPDFQIEQSARRFDLYLTDASGNTLLSHFGGGRASLSAVEVRNKLRPILDGTFSSGAQIWETGHSGAMLAGYQKLPSRDLTVLGLLPADEAYSSVRGLVWRTLILGLSFLAGATGLTLLFIRRLTEGLRQMAEATRQVSQGVFSVRVKTHRLGNDELGLLAGSFNSMAEKIDELMKQTAAKVEVQKNLETVQSVQNLLVPTQPFSHANMMLSGLTQGGGECGGDWWNYASIRDHLIIVVGNVSGRGLSAAMLTAAAHGAFSTFASAARLMKIPPPLRLLLSNLNNAICDASRGQGRLSGFATCFELSSGTLQVVNFGGPQPILFRQPVGPKEAEKPMASRFHRIGLKEAKPLGSPEEPIFQFETYTLMPEDMVLWFTPGLFEVKNMHGQPMLTQQRLQEDLFALFGRFGAQADAFVKALGSRVNETFGTAATQLPVDVTLLIAAVPKKAFFMRTEPETTKPASPKTI